MKRNERIETLIDMMMDPDNRFKPTKGQEIVLESYDNMKDYDSKYLVIDDVVWSEPRKQMLKLLRDAEVDKIVITHTGTALMGLIHFLSANGCELEETVVVKSKNRNVSIRGLLFKIN